MRNFIVKCFFCLFCLVSDYAYGCLDLDLNIYNNTPEQQVKIAVSGDIDVRISFKREIYQVKTSLDLRNNECVMLNILKADIPTDADFLNIKIEDSISCDCAFKPYEGELNYYPSLKEKTNDVTIGLDDYGKYCLIIGTQQHIDYKNFSYFSNCSQDFSKIQYSPNRDDINCDLW